MSLHLIQLHCSRHFHAPPPLHSPFIGCFDWRNSISFHGAFTARTRTGVRRDRTVLAMSATEAGPFKMNLNEYMVTLEKPLGIRFALSVDGKIYVHALKKGGNAEKSRIIMVGDTLKKASNSSGGGFIDIEDISNTQNMLKEINGSFSLVLERPFSPFPIHQLHLMGNYDTLFNSGKVPITSWNGTILASNLQSSSEGNGHSGFVVFSPKFLRPRGWKVLNDQSETIDSLTEKHHNSISNPLNQLVSIFSEEESSDVEWAHGSFPLEEYIKALDRAKGELYYNHSLGMRYSKITEQIYVGSCIQTDNDVKTLAHDIGITAILNFQSESERANWGINSESINECCRQYNILMVNYPIREVDSIDLRKKLPFCVGLLLRLLRQNFRIFVTCTTGFDRSPACVIAYLHWIQDTALHMAHNFVTGLHSCRPDRPAIVWATWDLIAMVENGRHDGPPTHAVTFVWNHGCREGEDVCLIGDFTGNWKDSVKAVHKGGSRYEVELRLPQGKYHYKFIVSGHWRHSTALPTETDERGNINNVIRVGDVACIRSWLPSQQIKDPTLVKVIERPLTEDERFMLAFAARRIAFAICPNSLAPKWNILKTRSYETTFTSKSCMDKTTQWKLKKCIGSMYHMRTLYAYVVALLRGHPGVSVSSKVETVRIVTNREVNIIKYDAIFEQMSIQASTWNPYSSFLCITESQKC